MNKMLIKIIFFLFIFGVQDTYAQSKLICDFDKNKLIEMVNDYRQNGCKCGSTYYKPVAPIVWSEQLESAAKKHADDMNAKNFFSHTSSDGRDGGYRIKKAGFNWSSWGENIGKGYNSENEVIEGWISSSGHCKNIMNTDFKFMGVAKSGNYWVQVFAAKKMK